MGCTEDYTAPYEKWENRRWLCSLMTYIRRCAKLCIQYQTSKQSLFLTLKAPRNKDAIEKHPVDRNTHCSVRFAEYNILLKRLGF